jgi:hypothetical protein
VRTRAAAAILAAAALVALVLPAGAAATKTYKQPAALATELDGHGTNGFQFFLFSGDTGFTVFSTSKDVGEGAETSVNYFEAARRKRADAADGSLDVKIGRLGHFRGHFVAISTKTEKPSKICEGKPTTTEKGHFVGSFKFHGERGYTTIDAHLLSGSVTHIGAQTCKLTEPEEHRSPRQEKAQEKREEGGFRLVAANSGARTLFEASREEAPPELHVMPTNYGATVAGGKVGKFRVSYDASVFNFGSDGAESFRVPNLAEPLSEAIIEPAAPFSGTATFHLETPKKASWTGDLAVELPGLGTVPLTGLKIAAGLCHGSDCTKTLPRLAQRALEARGGDLSTYFVGDDTVAAPERQSIR